MPPPNKAAPPNSTDKQQPDFNKNHSVRYDAVTGDVMHPVDIPNGKGGFVQIDFCKTTGGWFLDKNELADLRNVPGIVQILQTYSAN